jgi:HlyD family secretion protein
VTDNSLESKNPREAGTAGPRKLVFPAVAAIVAISAGSWFALDWMGRGDDSLHVSGNIEATEVAISFKIPGRVIKRNFDEGEAVKKGDVVAELETADLQADVAVARAQLQAAEATLAALVAGSRPQEIAASAAEFHAAEADREHLKRDLDRDEQVHRADPGAISQEQLDHAYAAYRMANERYLQTMKRYELVKEGPRKEDIDQARAKVAQAKATLQSAETKLSYATVTSPLTGVVLSKNIEPGEYVAAGTPVVTVADIENVWLRAYVDERDLGKRNIALGAEAEITTDAYPGKVYKGRISFISSEQEFTPKSVQTNRERVKFVYRIKIDVKNPDKELKPGMPADARIGSKYQM